MIAVLRVLGYLMMAAGVVVLLVWAFEPLRAIWPWFLALPLMVRLGLGIAALGFSVLFATVLFERLRDRAGDESLKDDW